MASEMVLAYGDNGLEPTPADQVVEIPVLALAPGNRPIPQTIRALGKPAPARITGIARKGEPWPYVSWRDADGSRGGCYVRNTDEANDPLFACLPAASRARILAAASIGER